MKQQTMLDTQLFVLLTVGLTGRHIIGKHKSLTAFTEDDFDLLQMLIGSDDNLILLPNIASEVSNLLRYHRDPEKSAIMRTFAALVAKIRENYIPTRDLVERPHCDRLGVTDTAILEGCGTDFEILTADAELHLVALDHGLRSTNFNHKREEFGIL